jgi:anti-sigma regulatory factor (Ser/Thr protein kinase)
MKVTPHQPEGTASPKALAATPPKAEEELRCSYPADPQAVCLARDEFAALAGRHGATGDQIAEIRLLMSEAVSNAVRHAYPDEPGPVYAMAAVSAGQVTMLVSDDGVGPRIRSCEPGAGWGWPLIAALSDQFTIRRRSNGGTELEMHLRIGPDPGASPYALRGSDSSASMPA